MIAGTKYIDCSDEMESMEYDFYHQNNFFWVRKEQICNISDLCNSYLKCQSGY